MGNRKKFPLPRSSISLQCHPAWESCLQHTALFGSHHRGFLNLLSPVFELAMTLSPAWSLCPYLDLLAHWHVSLQYEAKAKPGLWGAQKCSWVKLREKNSKKKKKKHRMFHGFFLQIWCNTTRGLKNILRLPITLSIYFSPALWTIYTFCLQGDLQMKQTDTQAPEELFFAL